MIKVLIFSLISFSTFAVSIGDSAPTFSLNGTKNVNLADLKGKYVVLEWFNDGCPFVKKHYRSNNMQKLQKKYQDKVTWLTINSSASGKQGHLKDISAAKAMFKSQNLNAHALLLDPDGAVGRSYSAKTTPHMYIIDPKGKLVYQGAIDSIASADSSDIPNSVNYVDKALTEIQQGKKVSMAKTRAYGCSVKY